MVRPCTLLYPALEGNIDIAIFQYSFIRSLRIVSPHSRIGLFYKMRMHLCGAPQLVYLIVHISSIMDSLVYSTTSTAFYQSFSTAQPITASINKFGMLWLHGLILRSESGWLALQCTDQGGRKI